MNRLQTRCRIPARRLSCAVLLLAACSAGGCAGYNVGGYQAGAASLYPPNIHSVYIPMIQSNSYRRGLGERLTEAVAKRIEEVAPIKVVHSEAEADSVLLCNVVNDSKQMVMQTPTSELRQGKIDFQVNVNWVDRKGQALRPQATVTPVMIEQSSNMFPELGQSIAVSQQQTIDKLAKQIVDMMEAPW